MSTRCPARFWRFAIPVLIGNTGAWATSAIVKRTVSPATHPETRQTLAFIASTATFWLLGGLAWVAMHPEDELSLTGGR